MEWIILHTSPGNEISVNARLITTFCGELEQGINSTAITFMNGHKILVTESYDEVKALLSGGK